jgi:hypothetical protein
MMANTDFIQFVVVPERDTLTLRLHTNNLDVVREIATGFASLDEVVDALVMTLTAPVEVGELQGKLDELTPAVSDLADRVATLELQREAELAARVEGLEEQVRTLHAAVTGRTPRPAPAPTPAAPPAPKPVAAQAPRTLRKPLVPHVPSGGAYDPTGRDVAEVEGAAGLQQRGKVISSDR